ncbi:MAG: galactose mutarotase [Bacteroidales bacterium]|nr:galactose mutarotase [Bacteroidales bacterium]
MTGKSFDRSKADLLPAENFKTVIDGKDVTLHTLEAGAFSAQITNFGGRLVGFWAPDRNGRYADVVVGYENIDRYVHNTGERFLGANPGTVANRIAKGRFTLDGVEYRLPINNGPNTLHGGLKGVDMLVWDIVDADDRSIRMTLVHPDGLDGFPGNVTLATTYTLSEDGALKIVFEAVTDKPTIVNMTHHSFFNLRGSGNGDVRGHILTVNASACTAIGEDLIPTGEIRSVEGTARDFRTPHAIGERVDDRSEDQMVYGSGYDHNFVLDKTGAGVPETAATLYEPESGRTLELLTDQPGLQVYSGYFFIDGKTVDRYGNTIKSYGTLSLEPQKYPDSINHEGFPDTVLRPGGKYTHTSIYRFGVKD